MHLINLVFIISTIFGLFVSRLISKKWMWGYILGGALFGFYNEITFQFCWTYSNALAPMIWKDVPLVVVIGWGVVSSIAMSITDRVTKKLNSRSGWLILFFDILFFSILGVINETSLSSMGYWKYNFEILGYLPIVIMGYIFVGLITSSIGRRIQKIL